MGDEIKSYTVTESNRMGGLILACRWSALINWYDLLWETLYMDLIK